MKKRHDIECIDNGGNVGEKTPSGAEDKYIRALRSILKHTEGTCKHLEMESCNKAIESIARKALGLNKRVKYAARVYECRECGHQKIIATNHRLDCYPTCDGKCRQIINPHTAFEKVTRKQTAHRFVSDTL